MALASNAPTLLRLNDAAAALGISRRTIYGLIASGDLPAFKLLSATVVRTADIDAYVASLPRVHLAA
jgi:excisionase family DNA binding protein